MADHVIGRLLAATGLLTLTACGGGSTASAAPAAAPSSPPPANVEVVTDWADLGDADVRFVRLNGMCFAQVRSEYDNNVSFVLAEMRSGSTGYHISACEGD